MSKTSRSKLTNSARVHHDLCHLPLFAVSTTTPLEQYVGKRCVFKVPKAPAEHERYTVQAVQRLWDGSLGLRVVSDQDTHKFGRAAMVGELEFYAAEQASEAT